MLKISYEKLGIRWRKVGIRFWTFSITHPDPLQTLFLGGYICGYLSDYQQIAIHNCYPKFEYGDCYRDKSDKKQKRHWQSNDYQCLLSILRGFYPFKSGGGGGRTRVQTRNPRAFYTFSRPFRPSPRARQAAAKPEAQPLNLAWWPRHTPRYL